jgi:hypothetical protein
LADHPTPEQEARKKQVLEMFQRAFRTNNIELREVQFLDLIPDHLKNKGETK